jgi:arsenate reductase (glutaredoxin)
VSKNKLIIYHHARCKKSRAALHILLENGLKPEVREYFKSPITETEFQDLLMRLHKRPDALIRTKEKDYINKFRNKDFTDSEWIKILIEYPHLMRRPVIVKGLKAIIGDSPEAIEKLLA